jgi:antitoxin YefM
MLAVDAVLESVRRTLCLIELEADDFPIRSNYSMETVHFLLPLRSGCGNAEYCPVPEANARQTKNGDWQEHRGVPQAILAPVRFEDIGLWRPAKDVTIIMVMDRTLPLANVKAHLSEIVDQVESGHDRVILTRNGRAAAVILSPDDLEALEETLDLLSQPNALEEIRKAREELDAGRFVTGDELRKRFRRP